MAKCDQCGNEYDNAFQITMNDRSGTFDSFECAIQAMAPQCSQCGCRIVGHGMQSGDAMYCCAHCSEQAGASGLKDRV